MKSRSINCRPNSLVRRHRRPAQLLSSPPDRTRSGRLWRHQPKQPVSGSRSHRGLNRFGSQKSGRSSGQSISAAETCRARCVSRDQPVYDLPQKLAWQAQGRGEEFKLRSRAPRLARPQHDARGHVFGVSVHAKARPGTFAFRERDSRIANDIGFAFGNAATAQFINILILLNCHCANAVARPVRSGEQIKQRSDGGTDE